jgi:HEAT repeat protein
VAPLRQLVYEEEFEWLRPDAVKALGYIHDRAAVDLLMELFLDPHDTSINDLAGDSLARVGRVAVRDLVSLLGEENYQVYNPAKVALVKIGPPAVRRLAKALNSFVPHVRVRAFQVLEQIGSPEAHAAVAFYRRHPDPGALPPDV